METLIILAPFIVWYLLKESSKSNKNKSSFIKLDDKNFIINNEFVSFDENTPLNIYQQEREDNEHYKNYERTRLDNLIHRYENMYMYTKNAIHTHSDLFNNINYQDIIDLYDVYFYEYSKVIDNLNNKRAFKLPKLSAKEFVMFKKHPLECRTLLTLPINIKCGGIYTIFSPDNAKYSGDDGEKLMEKEFEEKWLK